MSDSNFDDVGSIIRLAGFSVPARARFMGEAVMSATLTSLAVGLCGGIFGAAVLPTGPLVPFIWGSWVGYSGGLVRFYKTCVRDAMHYSQKYPTIIAHAMRTEHQVEIPKQVVAESERRLSEEEKEEENHHYQQQLYMGQKTLQDWISEGGYRRMGWAILAAQSCRPDVLELHQQQRQKLLEEYQENHLPSS